MILIKQALSSYFIAIERVLMFISAIFLSFIPNNLFAQCNVAPALFMQNPSFEGPRQPHQTPGPWQTCQIGQTPDTQPGSWGVNLAPSNGNSYLGLVAQYANNNPSSGNLIWQEGASQQLSGPMVAGTEYTFSVDLSNTNATGGGIDPGCAEVQIWGGFSRCDRSQLLWSSGNLTNFDLWQTFNVVFTPNQNFTWFSFMINPLGCSALPYVLVDNITPIQPRSVSTTLNQLQPILCHGTNTGSIRANTSGYNPPFSYNWSAPVANRVNDTTYHNLSAGSYSVTVTDATGCTATSSITLNQPNPFTIERRDIIDANCFGVGGSALFRYRDATPKRNFPFYDYNWSNGSTLPGTQTPLSVGTYFLTVTDSFGCQLFDTLNITRGAGFLTDTLIRRSSCLSPTNNIDIVVTPRGQPPYTYTWNTSPPQFDSIADGLNPGSYSVIIGDNSGCRDTLNFNINAPPKGVTISDSVLNVLCNGQNTGRIDLTVTSVNPISSYVWNPNVSSGASASNLLAGQYKITVTDVTGCNDSITLQVTEPLPFTDSAFVYNNRCFGNSSGYIDVSIMGGVRPYRYAWNTIPAQTDSIAKNLVAGNYTLTVTDTNNCVYILNRTVTQPSSPLTGVTNQTNVSCFGGVNGSASITLSGGTPPYFYEWTTDTSFIDTTSSISNLQIGTYYIRGIDRNGCSYNDTITITQPFDFVHPDFTVSNICNNDTAFFVNTSDTISNSNNFYFVWNFGDNTSSSLFQPNKNYALNGTYNVSLIANTNGCLDTISKLIYIHPEPDANFSVADICQRDSALILNNSNIGGGTMTYNWDFGDGNTNTQSTTSISHLYSAFGTYSIALVLTSDSGCVDSMRATIHVGKNNAVNFSANSVCENNASVFVNTTDSTGSGGINWSWNFGDGASSVNHSDSHTYASGGSYSVVLQSTTVDGCVDSFRRTVFVNYQPDAYFSVADICQRDSARILNNSNIGGGTMNYNWDFGDGNTSTQSTTSISHLYSAFGTYSIALVLTSDSGCVDSMRVPIRVGKNNNVIFSANSVCENNASVFVNTTDSTGSGGINWSWNFGDGASSVNHSDSHTYASGGAYSVLLQSTTVDGCVDSIRRTVFVNYQPDANFSVADVCLGSSSDFINQTTIGGGNFTSNWNFGNGNTSNTTNPSISYPLEGAYTVRLIVTSDSACVDTIEQITNVFFNPIAAFNVDTVCLGFNSTFINQTVLGSATLDSWSWTMGDGTGYTLQNPIHEYQAAGDYTIELIVSTLDGCSDTVSNIATVNELPIVVESISDETCFGEKDGSISLNTSGGRGPYQYSWNGTLGGSTLSNIGGGTYNLTVTDANRCASTFSFVLASKNEISIDVFKGDATCFNKNTGQIRVFAYGGEGIASYLWSNGSKETWLRNINAGLYSLTVTDSIGCKKDTSIVVDQPDPVTLVAVGIDSIYLGENTQLSVNYITTQPEAQFHWTPSTGLSCTDCENPIASPFNTTTYTVVMIDSAGCTDTSNITIFVEGEYPLYVPNAFTPNGDGLNDVFNAFTRNHKDFVLKIYNRWGEKVFEYYTPGDHTNENRYGWDGMYKGQQQPPGVYVFDVDVIYLDGKRNRKSGSVTLIR